MKHEKRPRPLPNLTDVDLQLLRTFHTVVRARGFSAAQLALNSSQPSISKAMAQLETRLDMELCKRGRGGFSVTPQGQAVFEYTSRLFGELDQFRNDVAKLRGEVTGELHVGLIDAVTFHPSGHVWQALGTVPKRFPHLQISMKIDSPEGLVRGLVDGRYDVIISVFPRKPSDLEYKLVQRGRQRLYCGRGHPLFDDPENATPDSLAKYPYVARSHPAVIDGEDGIEFNVTAKSADMEGIAALVLSGQFLGHLPERYAHFWVQDDLIRPVLSDQTDFDAEVFAAVRSSNASQLGRIYFDALSD